MTSSSSLLTQSHMKQIFKHYFNFKILYQVLLFLIISIVIYNLKFKKQSIIETIDNFQSFFVKDSLSVYHEMNIFGDNMDIYIFSSNKVDYDICNIIIYESSKNTQDIVYNSTLKQYRNSEHKLLFYNYTNIYWLCGKKNNGIINQLDIHAMLTVNSTTLDHDYSDFITQIMIDYPWIIDYKDKIFNVMYWSLPNTKRSLVWHNLEPVFKNVSLNHIKTASKYTSEVLYGKYICESYLQQNYVFSNSDVCNKSLNVNNNNQKAINKDDTFENYGFWYHLGDNQINLLKYLTDKHNKTKIYITETIHLQIPDYFYDLDNQLYSILEKNKNINTNYYFKDLYYLYRKNIIQKFKNLALLNFTNNNNNNDNNDKQLNTLFEKKIKKNCISLQQDNSREEYYVDNQQYNNANDYKKKILQNNNFFDDYNIIDLESNHCKKKNVYYNLITASKNWISNLNEPLAKNKGLNHLLDEKTILDYNLLCLLNDVNVENLYLCDQIAQEIAWINIIQSSNILDWILEYNENILECDVHVFENINYEYDIDSVSSAMGTYKKNCEIKQIIEEWKTYCPKYWVWDYNYYLFPNTFPNKIPQSIWYLKNIFNIYNNKNV